MRYGQSRQHYSFWELVQVFLTVYLPSTKFHKYGMIYRTTAKEKSLYLSSEFIEDQRIIRIAITV